MSDRQSQIETLRSWLRTEGRFIANSAEFDTALVERLRALGLPIVRFTTGVPSLHPQVDSFSTLWEYGKGLSFRQYRQTEDGEAVFRNSPLFIVYNEGRSVRCDLETPPQDGEFTVLPDLRAAGLTDYIVIPVTFSDGAHKAVSYATDRKGGFGDDDIAVLEGIAGDLAPAMETLYLRHLAKTLMDTYVGPVAGTRVLQGAIRRGAQETIRAAIWFCDLRGFTPLSETLPGNALIDLLNDYFDAVAQAIEGEGGEILKFIGDAVMAIFVPRDEDGDDNEADAARHALAAARAAQTALVALNAARASAGKEKIDCGIALHFGDLLYGNVGGANRLDFTVIGPAVNLASRIEGLTRGLDEGVLASATFAATHGGNFHLLGEFELKGIAEKRAVYAPR
ncbi:MAG TPA: adenylate/guanylate cyclase domain-containing protein [Alphaproteobacteria bacterium]|nr:adenylate/guanylate cyclase domain-containing protein [Alphaproteobacteria bacterium]